MGAFEVGIAKVSAVEVSTDQVSIYKDGTAQVNILEDGTSKNERAIWRDNDNGWIIPRDAQRAVNDSPSW